MPNPNVNFQGQILILPGAYYADNVSAAQPTTPPTTPPLIFVGYGYGQASGVAVTYASPQNLLAAIRGGPASGFVPFITDPSPEVNGAQLVTFINAAVNTQSSLNLLGTAPPSGVAVLTSVNYGVPSNLLQASVGAGSLAGKKVTIYDGFAQSEIVGDNLGVPFEVAYTGAATGGLSFTVATTGIIATSFTATSPNSGETATVNIGAGQYTTIEQIVNFLNGTGFWSAITLGDGTLPATYLDHQTATLSASGSGGYAYTNVTAALGSVVYWANQYASNYVTAAISGSVAQLVSGDAPANIPFTSFAGATSVPPTNQNYANALNFALTQPGWAVFVDSNAAAVQALLQQHVTQASEITNGAWRRGFTGSNVGDSVNTTISNAQSLDSNRVVYAYPGIYRTNTQTGINTLYAGLYAAAAAAGMATGNQPALPLTNKVLNGNGVEVQLNVSQINELQQAGVMCLGLLNNTNVPVIISDLTTWQIDNNPENIFLQQMQCRDYLAYSLVNALQPYTGTIAASITLVQVRNAVKACLNALIYTAGSNGVINSWDPNSLVLTYTGATQTLNVQVNVTLVGQNRFITIYVPIQPLNLVSVAA